MEANEREQQTGALHFGSAVRGATARVERLPRVMPALTVRVRDTFRCNCDVVSRAAFAERRTSLQAISKRTSVYFRASRSR